MERRWQRMLGSSLVAMVGLAAIGSLVPSPVGAGRWAPSACRADRPDASTLRRTVDVTTLDDVAREPWYRLDPIVDALGSLVGRRLTVGINGARLDRSMDLPSESFAAGPFGDVVLVGADDGARSTLMTIDVARRCTIELATSSDVIRSATIDPDGSAIVEHRVDRTTRADLGIWRRPVAGGTAQRWLDPLAPDPRFGRTWSTHLGWALDDADLVVQSCTEVACRVRVADRGTAAVRLLDDPGLGFAVGVAADRVVAHGACRGFPCPLVSVDLATGTGTILERAAGVATMVRSPRGPRVVVETMTTDVPRVRSVTPDGSDRFDLSPLEPGRRLDGDDGADDDGIQLPDGWVLSAPDGELRGTTDRAAIAFHSVLDGQTIPIDEVIR